MASRKKDYHRILGVSAKATLEDIKKAFRKLALEFHPDRNKSPEANDRFKEISEAYAILSGKEKEPQSIDTQNPRGGYGQGMRGRGNGMRRHMSADEEWAIGVLRRWQEMEEDRNNNMYR